MKDLMIKTCYVPYLEDPTNGKERPCVILNHNRKYTNILPITSKYKHKANSIKMWYFKINNRKHTGLNRPSWIDLSGQQPISNKYVHWSKYPHYLNHKECMQMFSKGIRLEKEKQHTLIKVQTKILENRWHPERTNRIHYENQQRDFKKRRHKEIKMPHIHPRKLRKINKKHYSRQNIDILKRYEGFSR